MAKLKEKTSNKSSVSLERTRRDSIAGFFGKKYGKTMSKEEILKDLRDKRDRF